MSEMSKCAQLHQGKIYYLGYLAKGLTLPTPYYVRPTKYLLIRIYGTKNYLLALFTTVKLHLTWIVVLIV